MAVMYGWTYANFNIAYTWDGGVEAKYLLWENYWSRKIDAYIFLDTGACPRLTDSSEKAQIGDIVNEMMVLTNLYLKASSTAAPMETGLYTGPGFPQFRGDRRGAGTEHYAILNKYKRRNSSPLAETYDLDVGP